MINRIILAVLLLLASFGARASYCGIPELGEAVTAAQPNVTYGTRAEAQAACESVPNVVTVQSAWGGGWFDKHNRNRCVLNQAAKSFSFTTKSFEFNNAGDCNMPRAPDGPDNGASGWHFTGDICPEGSTWNDELSKCVSPQECLARNADLAAGNTTRNYVNTCVAGCRIKATGPTVGVSGLYSGFYQYTGEQCSSVPNAPTEEQAKEDKKQECTPSEAGLTFCLKANGEHCATASNGRQVCFTPGETGEKDDGPVKTKRDPGTQEIPPNLSLPNGDTLTKTAGPVTKTTTVTDASGNTQTIVTTITNYTTTSGANAGPKNQGEKNDGSGDGKESDGEENGASGGGSCTQPPQTSGDPILGMIAKQTWETRCAIERTEAKGNGDITDCSQPYTVTVLGSANIKNASAENLRAQRAQLCPGEQAAPDPSQYLGDDEPAPELLVKGGDFEADDGGFGWGQTCPTIPPVDILGTSIAIDTSVFCNWMIVGGWFVLLLTGIKCLRMVTEA